MVTVCTKCILDSNDDPGIFFDENGVCNYCNTYAEIEARHHEFLKTRDVRLKEILEEIKSSKKGKYDCVIGLSGGTDSSYMVYLCKKWNLNPLVVHFDNGWNSVLSNLNIKNILAKANFDLYTYVVDWNEFKDIQRSYFKASVVDIEAITDHAIGALLYDVASKHNIKYILSGESTFTEGLLPQSWVHNKSDVMNLRDIQRRFGTKKIKTLPLAGFFKSLYYTKIKGIEIVKPLDYVDYIKDDAKKTLQEEMDWKDYGGKHNESVFTKFYQNYILPKKFGIDKRKSHLSTLIRAGQITRSEAFEELKHDIVDPAELQSEKLFVIKKLGFTEEEFDKMMLQPRIEHTHYRSIMKFYQLGSKIKRKILRRK